MSKEIKAIVFDCDGTLVDSELAHYEGWAYALRQHDFSFHPEDYYPYVGIPIDKTCTFLAEKVGKDCAEQLKRDKHTYFQAKIREGVSAIEDTVHFLHKLAEEQHRYQYLLAIASGAAREEILTYLRHLRIEKYFSLILSGKNDLAAYQDPEGTNKPKPYIYLEAAKRLQVHPQNCVAIEDSYPGVISGVRAGCITVAVPNPYSQQHDFSAAHLQVSSLREYSVEQFLREVSEA